MQPFAKLLWPLVLLSARSGTRENSWTVICEICFVHARCSDFLVSFVWKLYYLGCRFFRTDNLPCRAVQRYNLVHFTYCEALAVIELYRVSVRCLVLTRTCLHPAAAGCCCCCCWMYTCIEFITYQSPVWVYIPYISGLLAVQRDHGGSYQLTWLVAVCAGNRTE